MFLFCGCSSYMTVHSRSSCSSGVFLPVHDQTSFSVSRTSFSSATVQHWSTWDHSTTMQTEPHTPLDRGLGRLGATPGDSMDFQRMKTTVPTPFISPLWVWLAWAEARVTGITGLDGCPAFASRGSGRYSAMTIYHRLLCFASELIHSIGLSVYIERHYCRLHTVTAAVNRDGCGSTHSLQKCVCFLREVSVFVFLSPATLRVETVQHWDH